MTTTLKQFWQNEDGATAIEYALLAALISVAIIGAASGLGKEIGNTLTNAKNGMTKPAG